MSSQPRRIFWISSRVGHCSKVDHMDFFSTCLLALDVFFSYWTEWWFSQIFSTLGIFRPFSCSAKLAAKKFVTPTPQNNIRMFMVFQSSIKVAYDDHSSWIVTPWCSIARYHCCTRCFSVLWLRPIVLWGASDSALFVLSGFSASTRNGDSSEIM